MKQENDLPKSYFENKWYIREDLEVEQFEEKRHIVNKNEMKRIGNCFDSRFEAVVKCNAIRTLLGVELIEKNTIDRNRTEKLRQRFEKRMDELMHPLMPVNMSNIMAIIVARELKEHIDQEKMFNLGSLNYADDCDNHYGDVGVKNGLAYIYNNDDKWIEWTQRM